MAARITYANLPFGPNSFALFDQSFADTSALSTLPCSSSGPNNLVLTPTASAFPFTLNSYTSFYGLYTFVASDSSTDVVTASVNGLASLNVYLSDGVTQAGAASILNGGFYAMSFNGMLNGGTGGFYLISTGASTTNFALTGDVTATGTSPLVTTISPNVVTYDKLQQASQAAVLLANPTGAAANYIETTVGPTITFNGTALETAAFTGDVVTNPNSFVTTLSTGAVTLAQQANLPPFTVVGNNTNALASPLALSQTQLTSLVNNFTDTLSGGVVASGGGIVNFLRADGQWKPTTGGYVPLATLSTITPTPDLRDITHITAAYEDYYIVFQNVTPVVQSNFVLEFSQNGGGTWITTNYSSQNVLYANTANTGTATQTDNIFLALNVGVANNIGFSGTGTLTGLTASGLIKTYTGNSVAKNANNAFSVGITQAAYWTGNTDPITAIRFRYTSQDVGGNTIAFGKIKIYGIVTPT